VEKSPASGGCGRAPDAGRLWNHDLVKGRSKGGDGAQWEGKDTESSAPRYATTISPQKVGGLFGLHKEGHKTTAFHPRVKRQPVLVCSR